MAVFARIILMQLVMGSIVWDLTLGTPFNPSRIVNAVVEELKGVADFRSVRLSWKCNSSSPSGFIVQCCEMVAWGKDKCVTQLVNNSEAQLDANLVELPASPRRYETVVGGLRLATNYSFDVQPVFDGGSTALRGRSLQHNDITVPTRGFSASPRSCLGDRSEIDVETGPFFSGRISIEGSSDKRCTWIGDSRDPSFIHTFTINHEICGGNKKADRMENIIIVTESRSIITHTARRFMVVCYLLPETYTIKASLQIPGGDSLAPKAKHSKEKIPENFLDLGLKSEDMQRLTQYPDKMMSSKHTAELEQVAHLFEDNQKETTMAHLVLMVILVVAAAIGVTTTVWWFIGGARPKNISIPDLSISSRIEDDNSDDRKLVFVSSKDDDGEMSDPCGFNAESFGKSECATTFVLAPSMNMAFQTLGDSNC